MIKSLTILGAGNAGLMSALMVKKSFPWLDVTVVKSDKIGTIGVGEGSNEHWLEFAKIVGITAEDVVREADATLKHGIKFQGWRDGKDVYYHSLPEFLSVQENYTGFPLSLFSLIAESIHPSDLVWEMSAQGKIPYPIDYEFSQFHFNTFKLNSFLEKLCERNDIAIIEDTVIDAELDDNGNIKNLVGEKSKYFSEFFIDSSGFKRVVSSKLGTSWISYQRYLPTNSAIAFPTEKTQEPTPTFTLAKARDHGWSWRSPVYSRYGNGYVFSDSFADLETVLKEIQLDYDEPINIAKDIKFVSGKIDKFWIKNCLSIGLSGSFIEPLEASNIGTTINQIKAFMTHIVTWSPDSEIISNQYNKIFDKVSENILDFVQLHYITERADTDFWKWCKYEMPLTDFNKETLEHFKKNFVSYNFFHSNQYELFDELDWAQVMHGLNMFDIESIKHKYESTGFSRYKLPKIINEESCDFIDHDALLDRLRENSR